MTALRILAVCVAFTGCEAAPDATPANAGILLFRGLGEGVFLGAEVYLTPDVDVTLPSPGDGHCDIYPVGNGDSFISTLRSPPLPNVDLGETLVATNGVLTFTADRSPYLQYEGATGAGFAFGTRWTVSNAGGTVVTVDVPGRVTQDNIFSSIENTGAPVTLTYRGGEGAESFHVNITGRQATVDCYPAPRTTSFTLPPSALAVLDASFQPAIWAETRSVITIAGRRVQLRVTSDNLD